MFARPTRRESVDWRQDGSRQHISKEGQASAETVGHPAKADVSEKSAQLHGEDPGAGAQDVESGAALGFGSGEKSWKPGGESPIGEQNRRSQRGCEECAARQRCAEEVGDGAKFRAVGPDFRFLYFPLNPDG